MCKHLTSRLNWDLEVLVFVEGKNLENSKELCRKKVKQRDCLNLVNDMKTKKRDCKNLLHKSQIGVGGLKGNDFCVVLV